MPEFNPPGGTRRHRRPLPDAMAVAAVPVPATTPPYDDQAGPGQPAPQQRPRPPAAPAPPRRSGGRPPGQAPQPAPFAETWPSRFAQVLAETLAGSRPPGQLAPWTTEQARKRISQLGPMLATGRQPRIRRIRCSAPAAGVVELTVIVDLGTRVRAIAVRLERADPGWRCTAVEAA